MLLIIENMILYLGADVVTIGLIFFAMVNMQIIKKKALLFGLWGLAAVSMQAGYFFLINSHNSGTGNLFLRLVLLILAVFLFAAILRNALIRDFFQPLSLSNRACIILITGICIILGASLFGLLTGGNGILSPVMLSAIVFIMIAGFVWAKKQGWSQFENTKNEPLFLFKNGEGGYKTFRIPSLIAMDKDVLNNKYGYSFEHDVLLACAEARRNSSKDLGDIDMVGKLSADGGKTWTDLRVLFETKDTIGKVGNPTPVFDRVNGVLNFICTFGTKAENFKVNTYDMQGILNGDLTFTWKKRIRMGSFVPGPGKSIQLKTGRLVAPGDGRVMFSDDFGQTWQSGEKARGGECEAVELDNGGLMMVTRFGPGCSAYHPRQCQKLSFSEDGGKSWQRHSDTELKTPMCQSSLAKTSGGTLYFTHPDCYLTRANLAVGISEDNGETWAVKRLYNGPSAYSCVTADSEDNVYVLAEVGKVNYNEALVFLEIE